MLSLIREKYLQIELFDRDEVSTDLRLTLDIINQLKPLPGEEIDENIKCRSVNLVTNSCFYYGEEINKLSCSLMYLCIVF